MLTFEEKTMALSLINTTSLTNAVIVMSRWKRCASPVMREHLDKVYVNYYMLEDGMVERTDTGVIRFVSFKFPQQPDVITSEYFAKCKPEKQAALSEALLSMNAMHLIRSIKPAPVQKKERVGVTA